MMQARQQQLRQRQVVALACHEERGGAVVALSVDRRTPLQKEKGHVIVALGACCVQRRAAVVGRGINLPREHQLWRSDRSTDDQAGAAQRPTVVASVTDTSRGLSEAGRLRWAACC